MSRLHGYDEHSGHLADRPSCARCHSSRHLVTGDGFVVCWPCAFAWGAFAGLTTGGPTAVEPVMVDTCRAGHHQPRPGCAGCLGRLSAQNALKLQGPNGRRGPAA